MMLFASMPAAALEVITNPINETNTLSISTLRSIFSMRMTQWPDGTPIRVFVMGDKEPLHSAFSKQVLGVFPHQLRRAWNRQIYSGTGQAPAKVNTEAEMRTMVEQTPGAIGYLA
ncbi:MAG: substrate-binding domain-containing protein, partial [Pseudomonadota bacterium]